MPVTMDSRIYDELVKTHSTAKKVLAEGDSWFSYPKKFILIGKNANIIDHLGEKKDLLIYNSSNNGDELLSMLSGEQKFSLIKKLAHNHFDYLLFSGGGNDIVGKFDFDFLIKKVEPVPDDWRELIAQDRLKLRMLQIKSAYEMLCEIVKDYSKNKDIKIITHTYDIVIPAKSGYKIFDLIPLSKAWIYPYLIRKGITSPSAQQEIVRHILYEFKNTITAIQRDYSYFKVVNTQGAITKNNQWLNEIHPTSSGFKAISEIIYKSLG